MNSDLTDWCHDCDEPVSGWAAFLAHASAGHAITNGRCPDRCQFPRLPAGGVA